MFLFLMPFQMYFLIEYIYHIEEEEEKKILYKYFIPITINNII